jgi:hypothetical protein
MNANETTVIVPADPNADDCLTAAAESYIAAHPDLEGWDLCPRWADEDREEVALTVPEWHLDKAPTYRIEVRSEMGHWTQEGCWSGENASGMTEEEAEKSIEILREEYPDGEWRIVEETP